MQKTITKAAKETPKAQAAPVINGNRPVLQPRSNIESTQRHAIPRKPFEGWTLVDFYKKYGRDPSPPLIVQIRMQELLEEEAKVEAEEREKAKLQAETQKKVTTATKRKKKAKLQTKAPSRAGVSLEKQKVRRISCFCFPYRTGNS